VVLARDAPRDCLPANRSYCRPGRRGSTAAMVPMVTLGQDRADSRCRCMRGVRRRPDYSPWANKGAGWNKGEPDQVEWV
jgi:hypothetical protein